MIALTNTKPSHIKWSPFLHGGAYGLLLLILTACGKGSSGSDQKPSSPAPSPTLAPQVDPGFVQPPLLTKAQTDCVDKRMRAEGIDPNVTIYDRKKARLFLVSAAQCGVIEVKAKL